ncbi:MAG: hypothetical protein Kow0026_28230 [Oricola sp.]
MSILKDLIKKHSPLERAKAERRALRRKALDLEFLKSIRRETVPEILDNLDLSKSQLRQDLFVLSEIGMKRNGFFVEFGATNGVELSNTYLLETRYGWRGILSEPARHWHATLEKNRACAIDHRCVWSQSGASLDFVESRSAEYSTIDHFSASDMHLKKRRNGSRYSVETVSLNDLLAEHGAPHEIDYLSIDTEGSEHAILEAFDFDRHRFATITCEHNYTPNRERIHDLLTSKGYARKFEHLSLFDDWYVFTGRP